MKYGKVPGVPKPISRLVQGTVMINARNADESFALLDGVFELGCTAFDTAHGYGGGECERVLGRWIRERGVRDQVVILTKGAHHNQDRRRVTPFDITSDLHDSLARLQVDFIDLYVLHRDDPNVPVGPIVEVLNAHQETGLIGAFGGSNWSHTRIKAANDYAAAHGLTPFMISSPQFSLAEMVKEPWENCVSISGSSGAVARAYYEKTKIALFTWSSLAGGFFSGRFTRDNLDTFDRHLDKLCVHSYCYEENFQRLERAKELAKEKGLTLPQIALAYSQNHPLNLFSLVGCRAPQEFADNVVALETPLTEEEIHWLEVGHEL